MQNEFTSPEIKASRPSPNRHVKENVSTEGRKLRQSITIGRPAQDVFRFWRNFENLATFMKDIETIQVLSPTLSHWKVRLKNGMTAEWDAELTEEVDDQLLSWKSVEGSNISTSGSVLFEELSKEKCIVRLVLQYSIPGGRVTELVNFFTGEDPETLTLTNLIRLKAFLETGEIPTTQGQPSGRQEH